MSALRRSHHSATFSVDGGGGAMSPRYASAYSSPTTVRPTPLSSFTVAVSVVPGEQLLRATASPPGPGLSASPPDVTGGAAEVGGVHSFAGGGVAAAGVAMATSNASFALTASFDNVFARRRLAGSAPSGGPDAASGGHDPSAAAAAAAAAAAVSGHADPAATAVPVPESCDTYRVHLLLPPPATVDDDDDGTSATAPLESLRTPKPQQVVQLSERWRRFQQLVRFVLSVAPRFVPPPTPPGFDFPVDLGLSFVQNSSMFTSAAAAEALTAAAAAASSHHSRGAAHLSSPPPLPPAMAPSASAVSVSELGPPHGDGGGVDDRLVAGEERAARRAYMEAYLNSAIQCHQVCCLQEVQAFVGYSVYVQSEFTRRRALRRPQSTNSLAGALTGAVVDKLLPPTPRPGSEGPLRPPASSSSASVSASATSRASPLRVADGSAAARMDGSLPSAMFASLAPDTLHLSQVALSGIAAAAVPPSLHSAHESTPSAHSLLTGGGAAGAAASASAGGSDRDAVATASLASSPSASSSMGSSVSSRHHREQQQQQRRRRRHERRSHETPHLPADQRTPGAAADAGGDDGDGAATLPAPAVVSTHADAASVAISPHEERALMECFRLMDVSGSGCIAASDCVLFHLCATPASFAGVLRLVASGEDGAVSDMSRLLALAPGWMRACDDVGAVVGGGSAEYLLSPARFVESVRRVLAASDAMARGVGDGDATTTTTSAAGGGSPRTAATVTRPGLAAPPSESAAPSSHVASLEAWVDQYWLLTYAQTFAGVAALVVGPETAALRAALASARGRASRELAAPGADLSTAAAAAAAATACPPWLLQEVAIAVAAQPRVLGCFDACELLCLRFIVCEAGLRVVALEEVLCWLCTETGAPQLPFTLEEWASAMDALSCAVQYREVVWCVRHAPPAATRDADGDDGMTAGERAWRDLAQHHTHILRLVARCVAAGTTVGGGVLDAMVRERRSRGATAGGARWRVDTAALAEQAALVAQLRAENVILEQRLADAAAAAAAASTSAAAQPPPGEGEPSATDPVAAEDGAAASAPSSTGSACARDAGSRARGTTVELIPVYTAEPASMTGAPPDHHTLRRASPEERAALTHVTRAGPVRYTVPPPPHHRRLRGQQLPSELRLSFYVCRGGAAVEAEAVSSVERLAARDAEGRRVVSVKVARNRLVVLGSEAASPGRRPRRSTALSSYPTHAGAGSPPLRGVPSTAAPAARLDGHSAAAVRRPPSLLYPSCSAMVGSHARAAVARPTAVAAPAAVADDEAGRLPPPPHCLCRVRLRPHAWYTLSLALDWGLHRVRVRLTAEPTAAASSPVVCMEDEVGMLDGAAVGGLACLDIYPRHEVLVAYCGAVVRYE
ncbi:hypothetical protein NESM_000363500 [Novymonas esmeraldas]|uniref:EF-hand domain-containing protein n=1 Tax=Novymonas esmeraldas TaxID=1808958 RepID=A0AAW0EM08_9TRYP